MRQTVIDQKSNEKPQPATAIVQTDIPTAMSLNGLCLHEISNVQHDNLRGKTTLTINRMHITFLPLKQI